MDREAIARIIGSFVVYDDHGGPDTEVLADRIAATHDAAYDALMGLADQILALTPPPGAGGIAEAAAQLAGLQLGWKLGLRGDDDEYRLTFERWSAEIAEAKRSVALLASPSPKASNFPKSSESSPNPQEAEGWKPTREKAVARLRRAFEAGFTASSEAWNGDHQLATCYPERFEETFRSWYAETADDIYAPPEEDGGR